MFCTLFTPIVPAYAADPFDDFDFDAAFNESVVTKYCMKKGMFGGGTVKCDGGAGVLVCNVKIKDGIDEKQLQADIAKECNEIASSFGDSAAAADKPEMAKDLGAREECEATTIGAPKWIGGTCKCTEDGYSWHGGFCIEAEEAKKECKPNEYWSAALSKCSKCVGSAIPKSDKSGCESCPSGMVSDADGVKCQCPDGQITIDNGRSCGKPSVGNDAPAVAKEEGPFCTGGNFWSSKREGNTCKCVLNSNVTDDIKRRLAGLAWSDDLEKCVSTAEKNCVGKGQWNGYTAECDKPGVENSKTKHTITYDMAGGNIDGSTRKVTKYCHEGETFSLLEEPKKKDNEFLGWKYPNGQIVEALHSGVSCGTYAMVAQWKKLVFSIAYDLNGGKFEDGTAKGQTCRNGGTFDLAAAPVKKDNEFLAWKYENGNGSEVEAGFKGVSCAMDLKISAQWKDLKAEKKEEEVAAQKAACDNGGNVSWDDKKQECKCNDAKNFTWNKNTKQCDTTAAYKNDQAKDACERIENAEWGGVRKICKCKSGFEWKDGAENTECVITEKAAAKAEAAAEKQEAREKSDCAGQKRHYDDEAGKCLTDQEFCELPGHGAAWANGACECDDPARRWNGAGCEMKPSKEEQEFVDKFNALIERFNAKILELRN